MVVLLKTLVEDGEMLLADGRRILSRERAAAAGLLGDCLDGSACSDPSVVLMHPDFRMWVLANRPGFPFLGNNFFREAGDAFAVSITVRSKGKKSFCRLFSLIGAAFCFDRWRWQPVTTS